MAKNSQSVLVGVVSLAGVLTDISEGPTFHSCGTAADFHCSFPVSFSGCSPLKPAFHYRYLRDPQQKKSPDR